ncbi:hypothetical protein Adeg_0256 [Ammonifex degensii KC4]|uniref:Uncharacterized protein n=1 Tax=Ammonifex degensii (strain DSM 10501 / KC4) TaxID=429009 RepID=C9RAZ8_AMMDK|nr:hypothetical protein [Ammonifex degensii]ACX51425.1 hypothetical protein Adeg_0256 [Ammonifex degensii KC4]
MPEKILRAWLRLAQLQKEAIAGRQEDRLRHILEAKERLRRLLEKEGLLPSGEATASLIKEILVAEEEARVKLLEWEKEIGQEIDMLNRWREWAKNLHFAAGGGEKS